MVKLPLPRLVKFERAFIGLLATLVLACLALAAWQAYVWQRAVAFNRALSTEQSALSNEDANQSPLLQLAQAEKLRQAGKTTEALGVLRDVEARTLGRNDAAARKAQADAKFNSANIYLRQALDYAAAGDKAKALPPAELAKGLYRDVLRQEGAWDARYNLERALAIVPEADADENEVLGLPPQGERAVTTMRGVSPGMP
jgi:mxaK protein